MTELTTRYPGLDRIVFSEMEVARRVEELGREIDAFYPEGEALLVLGLLKGAFVFSSDLVRAISRRSLYVDFLIAALYGDGTDPDREVEVLRDVETSLSDRHVLLVEDIVDSGRTLNRVGDLLLEREPRSLEVCALLHKHVTDQLRYEPRWVGFDAPADWLVGYGLDLGERYRHLPFIAAVTSEAKRGI